MASSQPAAEPKSTPLLDALKAEKAAAKEKESSIRIQIHTARAEPPANSTILTRKEDPKKKAPPIQPSQADSTPPNTIGKRGRGKKHEPIKPPAIATTQSNPGPSEKQVHAQPPTQPKPIPTQPKAARLPREPPPRASPQKPSAPLAPKQLLTPSTPTTPKADSATAPSSTEQQAPRERTRRPIIGLQTRHFEAALSGAGVSISPGGNDRRARREQERAEASSQSQTAENTEGPASSAVDIKGKERPKSFGRRKEGEDKSIESLSGPRTGNHEGD